MNAIAGIVSKHLNSEVLNIVKKMCDIQKHRGPSGENFVSNEQAIFGVRSDANVPSPFGDKEATISENKTISVVSDCAICNAEEVRKDLEKRNPHVIAHTDSELILRLYEAYGPQCLEKLRGDFAFAIWDGKKKQLFMARDRFGLKPLYYYFDGKKLLFASEMKGLLSSGLVERDLDLNAIYHYLFFTFFYQPQTPFKNVRSLSPGNYLLYTPNSGDLKEFEYWDVPYDQYKPVSDQYLVSEGSKILNEAIISRVPSNARNVAVSLSGGIDSSIIAAILAKSGTPIKTFTMGFRNEDENISEHTFAGEVARMTGSIHSEITMSPSDLLNDLPKFVWNMDTPTAGSILPFFIAKAAKESDVTLLFRGDGAHSVFEAPVEPKFPLIAKPMSLLEWAPPKVTWQAYSNLQKIFFAAEPFLRNRTSNLAALLRLLSAYLKAKTGRHNLDVLFSERQRKGMFVEHFWHTDRAFVNTDEIVLDCMNRIKSSDLQQRLIYEEYKRFPSQGLVHNASINAGFSMDNRQPYFDHKLVEFSQNHIPVSMRRRGKTDKYILKRISENLLPTSIINRPQHPFIMPINKWLRHEFRPLVDNLLSRQAVGNRNIFTSKGVRTVYDDYYSSSGCYVSFRKIWSLVILEIWLRLYYDPDHVAPPSFTGADITP